MIAEQYPKAVALFTYGRFAVLVRGHARWRKTATSKSARPQPRLIVRKPMLAA